MSEFNSNVVRWIEYDNLIKQYPQEFEYLNCSQEEIDNLFNKTEKICIEKIRNMYFIRNLYNLNYNNPETDYERIQKNIGKYIYIRYGNGPIKELQKNDYIKLLNSFAESLSIKDLKNVKIISERI